jgi:hypothetical protein
MTTPGESAMVKQVIAAETGSLAVEYLDPQPEERRRWEEVIYGVA